MIAIKYFTLVVSSKECNVIRPLGKYLHECNILQNTIFLIFKTTVVLFNMLFVYVCFICIVCIANDPIRVYLGKNYIMF